jgi:hypothetical protein
LPQHHTVSETTCFRLQVKLWLCCSAGFSLTCWQFRDFRLPPRCWWDLRSSGV